MFAMPKKTFLADKNRVHAELMRLARAGQITYYSALGAAVGKHARWPLWPIVLERISDDGGVLAGLAEDDPEMTARLAGFRQGLQKRRPAA
jgi:hypothetical protein